MHAVHERLPRDREELGADVTARDCLGYGTVHGAAGRGMNDVILYLVSKGADPKILGRSGLSTIDLANRIGAMSGLPHGP